MVRYQQPPKNRRRLLIGSLVFFAIIILGGAALELTGAINLFGKEKKATSGIIPSKTQDGSKDKDDQETNEDKDVVPSSGDQNAPENPKQGDDSASQPTGAPPITPYGNFVSNHTPNLGGSPAPSAVQSVCNTSPGARCRIEFTNQDGIKKTLAAQTTDKNGATYWNWDVNEAGFTAGSWKIKVVAELNNQSASAEAAQNLEVKP